METVRFRWPPLAKWVDLLNRADEDHIQLTWVARSRSVMHASSSDGSDKKYIVGELGCSCPAGRHAIFCKHYCLYLFVNLDRLVVKYGEPPWVPTLRAAPEALSKESVSA
jgi:hypothetical protein